MRALTPLGLVAATTVVADQTTKILARALLPLCETHGSVGCDPVQNFGPARFVHVGNGGSALGFGQGQVVWILLALVGTIVTLAYARRRSGLLLAIAAGLQLGGAGSNLADRVALGHVTDFVLVGPVVINVADVALVLGCAIAVAGLATDTERRSPERLMEEVTPR
jgi:lipoprotein signal peptidase